MIVSRLVTRARSHVRPLTTRPAAHLLAHLTAPSLDVSVKEAYSILHEQPHLTVGFEEDIKKEGLVVHYADEAVSVLDFIDGGKGTFRCLHFNDTLDLVQSSISLDASGNPSILLPLPREYSKHVLGMSLSFMFYQMNVERDETPQTCAVLGAGGCILPMLTSQIYPLCNISAIELSPSVVTAARACFGVAAFEQKGQLNLHTGCALQWLEAKNHQQAASRLDLIFLDICNASTEGEDMHSGGDSELLAPPMGFLSEQTFNLLLKSLSINGVLTINMLGTLTGTRKALRKIKKLLLSLGGNYHIGSVRLGDAVVTLLGSSECDLNAGGMKKRMNSIVYIVNNPKARFSTLSVSNIVSVFENFEKNVCINLEAGGSFLQIPFLRTEAREDIMQWISESYLSENI